ncbi:MAG TPA: helix-turn-helix domain-containing protein [Galbitalea sp.]|nr:helix-turn-helix domain-containing protein [Galbitalea sp.]
MPAEPKANRGPSAGPDNRRALIAAAREVFGEVGLTAPLNSVAKRAGVGQGSLYRHFPDRVSLAVAVFDDNIGSLEELAARPDSTLDDLFDAVAAQAIASTALIDLISSNRRDPGAEHLATRVTGLAGILLARGQGSGLIDSQVATADVMLAIAMLAFAISKADPDERADIQTRAHRMFQAAFAPV